MAFAQDLLDLRDECRNRKGVGGTKLVNRAKTRPDLIIVALSETPFLYDFRSPGVAMPIAIGSFNLDEYRKSVRTLSDEDLIKQGKKMRWLSGDGKIVSTMPCAFYKQLKVCRQEWRRRIRNDLVSYPKYLSHLVKLRSLRY
jgi:hypothetical protein